MARITSHEALRSILQPPRPTTISKISDRLDAQAETFVRASPFAMLATRNAAGTVEVSPKGDAPGFVRIEDARTLLMPERAGNNLAFGLQNIIDTGSVAMIFLRPGTGETLRITGTAELHDDADLLQSLGSAGRPALLAIRVHVERCYFHCARAFLRSRLWDPASWPQAQRISFGAMIAARTGGDASVAEQIDANVQRADTTNLLSNG